MQGRIELGGESQTECWANEGRVNSQQAALLEKNAQDRTLSGKPQPCGNTQINGDGLV